LLFPIVVIKLVLDDPHETLGALYTCSSFTTNTKNTMVAPIAVIFGAGPGTGAAIA